MELKNGQTLGFLCRIDYLRHEFAIIEEMVTLHRATLHRATLHRAFISGPSTETAYLISIRVMLSCGFPFFCQPNVHTYVHKNLHTLSSN